MAGRAGRIGRGRGYWAPAQGQRRSEVGRGGRHAALRVSAWRPAVAVAAVVYWSTFSVDAGARGGGGGGHGGGGHGGGGGGVRAASVSRGGGGGFAVHSASVRHVGGGSRSLGAAHYAGRSSTTVRSAARVAPAGAGNRFTLASTHAVHAGSLARTASVARANAALGHRVIPNVALRSAIAPVRFHGRFLGSPWPWWRGGIVIGWVGPLFWPYAYYDFFDYVFWPYVYDDFWPYAYDDVYFGIYGPYAYSGPGVRVARGATPSSTASVASAARRTATICSDKATGLTDLPIDRISQTVRATDEQRALLDELKAATGKAVEMMRAACPTELPSIAPGRLTAMQSRLEVMLQAVQTVRPALDKFYAALSDEQKARFNAVAPADKAAATAKDQNDLTRLCRERSPRLA